MEKKKELGQVFTPDYIVDLILDDVGYTSGHILGKRIIEPSFGDGVFLTHIVKRIISECKAYGYADDDIRKELEQNVCGIEIDEDAYDETIIKLNALVSEYGFSDIKWNLYRQDALTFSSYGVFDYVVGNPPYIRVHNMTDDMRDTIKIWDFASGTTDIYIVFFELGLKLLNKTGKLGFITPNSWITNASQGKFRKYLLDRHLLSKIEDFGSCKVFDVDTYTCITILDNDKKNENFTYTKRDIDRELFSTQYHRGDIVLPSKPWTLTDEAGKTFLLSLKNKSRTLSDLGTAQYGFATQRDSLYTCMKVEPVKGKKGIVYFNGFECERKILKKVVKGSKYHGGSSWIGYILFPYERKHGKYVAIEESYFQERYPLAYSYLSRFRDDLEQRDMDKGTAWYQFGRSQGLTNCHKKKLVINHIVSPSQKTVEVYELPANVVVYSGIYITADTDENLARIKDELSSEDFMKYVRMYGKDMSGGYKSFNTKTINGYPID